LSQSNIAKMICSKSLEASFGLPWILNFSGKQPFFSSIKSNRNIKIRSPHVESLSVNLRFSSKTYAFTVSTRELNGPFAVHEIVQSKPMKLIIHYVFSLMKTVILRIHKRTKSIFFTNSKFLVLLAS
jgi:hypothetical protein